MFSGDVTISRKVLTIEDAKTLIEAGVEPCLNPSHEATIEAMTSRFGIEVEIPASPPRVTLSHGDSVIVMGVQGLPRLTDRHEYTPEEIEGAHFEFVQYTVL